MSADVSLFRIVEVLQVPLGLRNGALVGGGKGRMKTTIDGLELDLEIIPLRMFLNEQCGVLVRVVGDLSLVVSYFQKTGMLSLFVIDEGILRRKYSVTSEALISAKMSLKGVVTSLGESIVGSFYCRSNQWKTLTLPK